MDPPLRESGLPSSGLRPQRGDRAAVKQPYNTEAILRGNNYLSTTTKQEEAGVEAREPSAPICHNSGVKKGLQDIARETLHLGEDNQKTFCKSVVSVSGTGFIEANDDEAKDSDDEETTVDYLADKDDFQRPAKLDLIIGFLRLFNFLSVSTSVFAVIVSVLFPIQQTETIILNLWQIKTFQEVNDTFSVLEQTEQNNPLYPQRDLLFYLRVIAGSIQLAYLFVNAVFVIIDSIATVTFRWKEYGELTHRHTDATSIMFLVSKSRWKQRFLAGLTVTSAASLQTAQIILNFYGQGPEGAVVARTPDKAVHAVVWYLGMMGAGLFSVVMGFLLYLIPAHWRDVLWLDNYQTEEHIDDSDDRWKSFRHLALHCQERGKEKLKDEKKTIEGSKMKQDEETDEKEEKKTEFSDRYKQLTCFGVILETQKRVIYFISYVMAITMNIYTFLLLDVHANSFEFWTVMMSTVCNSLISLYLVILVSIQFFRLRPQRSTPFLSTIYVPFVLSCGLRLLLDVKLESSQQYFFGYIYISLLGAYIFLHVIGLIALKWTIKEPINYFFAKFFKFNFFTSEGAYKKFVRVFDTMGSFLGLVGLLLGVFSLVCDQYDLEFELEGDLKEMMDGFHEFYDDMKSVADKVENIIDELDFRITCETIHKVVGGGVLVGLGFSLIPGASTAARLGTKTTYYVVKARSALSKLASTLRSSVRTMWRIAKITNRVAKFAFGNYSKFTIGGSTLTLLRLLPFLPPVVVGIHVVFSAFWPQRILFFSASQRRRFMNRQKWHWRWILLLLILALCINTVLIDELQAAFNDSLPFLDVHVKRKLGWRMSVAASAFAMASAFSFMMTYWILENYTYKNHDNITKEEVIWKKFVDSKKKVTYYNAFGPKIEWKNQIKYKKERIGGWTWVLPIFLCTIACGLGVLANLYPKLNMVIEPKGKFGRAIDTVLNKVSMYEDDMKKVKRHGEEECLPFATIRDVLRENMDNRKGLLMTPINNFFNQTDNVVQRLKEVVRRTRRQLITDVGDSLFGEEATRQIRELDQLDLQYLGLVLVLPRLIQLFILIFGMLSMSCAVWQGTIFSSFEPRKIVNVFGKMCMFSFVYCILTQVAIFSILTDFGIPFYKISISWGLGFMYDVASEAIMWSIWIGMNNQFFFAIPKRKKTVTYSIPGVSDYGPNIENTWGTPM